jgi:molybdate transport system ATP-binding protein
MKSLQISQQTFHRDQHQRLFIEELQLDRGERMAFIGANGSGKSTLGAVLAGEIAPDSGQLITAFSRPVCLSFEKLSALLNAEWQRKNSDLFREDENPDGLITKAIIQQDIQDNQRCGELAKLFGISHLLDRPFSFLSTGETRKALLCQALMSDPDLLILDEPFDGLDAESRTWLTSLTEQLMRPDFSLVFILNRFSDIRVFVNKIGLLAEGELRTQGTREAILSQSMIRQLAQQETLHSLCLPPTDTAKTNQHHEAAVVLKNGRVSWNDNMIIDRLTWSVLPGEHWQITGPNGAGKSTLLSLITGEHPQGFSNDLTLFGMKRGSGETLADIRQHIGYVSSSLHQSYRVSATVIVVVLSGYYDTIGLYQSATERQKQLAHQWLTLIGLTEKANTPFQALSWGQQRLVLIVRALVKHPRLLILDEPLQGLDSLNRLLVKQFIESLLGKGSTQLLFVSHHNEDAPNCITHRLQFIAKPAGGYQYKIEQIATADK